MGNRTVDNVSGNGLIHTIFQFITITAVTVSLSAVIPGCDNPASETNQTPEGCWIEDDLPPGASWHGESESFTWVENPHYSGSRAHQSVCDTGVHQHFFENASPGLTIENGATLYTYVYLDPDCTPEEVMLQWNNGSTWKRAYWGSDKIGWEAHQYMGDLPAKGKWVKLSVAASDVDLEGATIQGWAFSLYGGKATWDASGVE